jgi:hypothetical protein
VKPLAFRLDFWEVAGPTMRFRLAFLTLPIAALALAVACGGEGEGMPCDTAAGNGGDDDCANGLKCTTGLTNAQGARCCPTDRTKATTPECSLGTAVGDAASPAPPDASGEAAAPAEASANDGATGAEAQADGGTEASAEAAATDGATSNDGPTE